MAKIPWESPLLSVILPALLALAGVIVGAYLTYYWGLKAQINVGDHQKRHQTFSQLMGQKFVTTQLYVSRFEALIFSDFHEHRWRLAGHPKESLDLQEAQRWMHKSEDLALEIARSNQHLFELIGLVKVLFKDSEQLNNRIEHIYRFQTPKITAPPEKASESDLESWKRKAVTELQSLVDRQYAEPIDALLDLLAEEIRREGN